MEEINTVLDTTYGIRNMADNCCFFVCCNLPCHLSFNLKYQKQNKNKNSQIQLSSSSDTFPRKWNHHLKFSFEKTNFLNIVLSLVIFLLVLDSESESEIFGVSLPTCTKNQEGLHLKKVSSHLIGSLSPNLSSDWLKRKCG